MRHGLLSSLSGLLGGLVLLAACSGGGARTGGSTMGKAVFVVSDAAADMGAVSKVNLTIDSVRIHASGGAWTAVSTEAKTFDLLELDAKGTSQLLAQADITAGTYDQIELQVTKAVVVDAKGEHEAKLPSGKLQLKGTLEVKAGATASANFDFLADQSLHVTGEGRYILAPVIKLETKADAKAEIQSNNEVRIQGGQTTTQAEVGMDIEGNVDAGLRITPDAVLTVSSSGKVVQTRGHALAVGTIKAVDTTNGTVTITTKGGNEIVLHLAGNTSIRVKGAVTPIAGLAAKAGAEVLVEYNTETKALATVAAEVDAKSRAEASSDLKLTGTVKSVDAAKGTVTVATDSGADVVLQIGSNSKIQLDGAIGGLLGLGAQVGSRVEARYDASTRTVNALEADASARAAVNGTIKAVDTTTGAITIVAKDGTEVTLKVESDSKLMMTGTMTTLAALKSMVGAEVTAEYSQRTKAIANLNARLTGEQATSVRGVLKAVNTAQGTVTIVASDGGEVVLNVTGASSISTEGSAGSLASLASKIGSEVTVQYNAQTKTVAHLNVHGQAQTKGSVTGTLKSVDATAGTITIAVAGGADLVLNVASDARLQVDGAATALAALAARVGSQVTVEYNTQTKAVVNLEARSRSSGSQISVSGTLLAINAPTNTVLIGTATGAVEVIVNADTKIELDGTSSFLANLGARIGSQVSADYNSETKVASRVSVRALVATGSMSVTGTLKSVNVLTNTVTVTTASGAELVLDVTSATKLQAGGTVATTAALTTKIGGQVTVEYNAQTNAATSISAA